MTISIAPSIATQYAFFEREIRFFPLKRIVIGFFERMYKNYLHQLINLLDEVYTDLQGALVVLKVYSQEDAQRDLPNVKRTIKILITYRSYLEKAAFLNSEDVKLKIDLVISTMYEVEIQLKKKAFVGQSRIATRPELIEAIASASKEAITTSFYH
jgi:hypothetical protein